MEEIVSENVVTLREYNRKYRAEHRETINATSRKWYAANAETHIGRTKKWRNENKEVVASARKKLYDSDPERFREKRREEYWKNPEAGREAAKKYIAEHPEAVKLAKRKWYENNLDRNRNYAHNRRAKVRDVVGGHFTDEEFQQVCEKTGNVCLCCRRTNVPLTADHIIPLGPPHSDEISNIQPLCLSCNSSKGTKDTDYRNRDVGVAQPLYC